jgi:hypothetical protein
MTRILTLVLAISFALSLNGQPVNATTKACTGYHVTKTTGPVLRHKRMDALIKCVFTEVGIPGQHAYAEYVSDRESDDQPWAYNASGCAGLFQHMVTYWRGRALRLPLAQFPHRDTVSPFNARANAWAAAMLVKSGGWSPWAL